MAARVSARIEGLKRLRAFVKNMPEEARAQILNDLKQNLEGVAAEERARVPYKTGSLHDAIRVRLNKRTLSGRVGVFVKGRTRVRKGRRIPFYVRFVEFGTVKTPARPFLFPAWRRRREKTKADIKSGIARAIKRAAAR